MAIHAKTFLALLFLQKISAECLPHSAEICRYPVSKYSERVKLARFHVPTQLEHDSIFLSPAAENTITPAIALTCILTRIETGNHTTVTITLTAICAGSHTLVAATRRTTSCTRINTCARATSACATGYSWFLLWYTRQVQSYKRQRSSGCYRTDLLHRFPAWQYLTDRIRQFFWNIVLVWHFTLPFWKKWLISFTQHTFNWRQSH